MFVNLDRLSLCKHVLPGPMSGLINSCKRSNSVLTTDIVQEQRLGKALRICKLKFVLPGTHLSSQHKCYFHLVLPFCLCAWK